MIIALFMYVKLEENTTINWFELQVYVIVYSARPPLCK